MTVDLEKKGDTDIFITEPAAYDKVYSFERLNGPLCYFWRMCAWIDRQGEARGIERQPPDQRLKADWRHCLRLAVIWIGATGSIPSLTGFFSGSTLFGLGFKSALSASFFGTFVGSAVASFGAIMGPRSGLRAMVISRFLFGWWFAKFIALLNVLTLIGWAIVSSVFGGQLLSALTPNGSMSVVIGILICFLVTLIVCLFGVPYVSMFDRLLVCPILVAFLLIYICTARDWNTTTPTVDTGADGIIAWLNMFQSSVGITSTWLTVSSDYYIDLPEKTSPWKVYFSTLAAVWVPTAFVGAIGVGLAAAATFGPNGDLMQAYDKYQGAGLMVESMKRWGGGGKFLLVLVFISQITNQTFSMYSLALSCQVWSRQLQKFPRFFFSILGCVLFFVLSAVGRNDWATVVGNFLPMIGYWSMIYGTILIIEVLVFRHGRKEFQWDQWDNSVYLRTMWAAIFAFCCGIVGIVLGMNQYYYVGRISELIGTSGGELGTFFAVGFSAVGYLVARPLEIRLMGMGP